MLLSQLAGKHFCPSSVPYYLQDLLGLLSLFYIQTFKILTCSPAMYSAMTVRTGSSSRVSVMESAQSVLLAIFFFQIQTMLSSRISTQPKTTKQVFSVAWIQILSWSVLEEHWVSGHIRLHKRCKIGWREMILHGIDDATVSTRNTSLRIWPTSTLHSTAKWTRLSMMPTRKSPLYDTRWLVCS